MKVTIDRREEDLLVAILPGGECISFDKKLCPEAKEGDVIVIEVSKEDTEDKKKSIEEKLNRLKNRNFDK